MVQQFEFILPAFPRGFHLVSDLIIKNLNQLPEKGILHIFIKHTSAALSISENYDRRVRDDLETIFDKLAPENFPYTHDDEGADDMPAHVKTALIGNSVTIPITNHKLNLGTWQGIYLCEFRNSGGGRKIVLTVYN